MQYDVGSQNRPINFLYAQLCLRLQSSWTKMAVEVDSPKPMQPWDQSADPPDSTCAQVTQSWPEAFGNYQVPMTSSKDYQEQDDELGMHGSICSNCD